MLGLPNSRNDLIGSGDTLPVDVAHERVHVGGRF